MRIAYFDCFSGASGDMCLGALVSAGWPREEVGRLPQRIGLSDVTVTVRDVMKGPFAAVKVDVSVTEGKQPHRHLHHIKSILEAADLPDTVRNTAYQVFHKLAEAEAAVHGSTVEKVHFHEVGAADALVDVVGTVLGLEALGVEKVFAGAPPLGKGFVMSQHGRIPIPAPATALLLRGAPVQPSDIEAELVTPTGAALLATLVEDWEARPAYRLETVGTGAGTHDLEAQPNVLRLLIGEVADAAGSGAVRTRVAVLETSVDDENPQFVAAVIPRLLKAGALDAMWAPTVMKKGRPGVHLTVIARPEDAGSLAAMLLRETSTLGVRMRIEERLELERRIVEVETPYGTVRLKIASLPDGTDRAVPEFESVREVAEKADRPLREISESAIASWSKSAKDGSARSRGNGA